MKGSPIADRRLVGPLLSLVVVCSLARPAWAEDVAPAPCSTLEQLSWSEAAPAERERLLEAFDPGGRLGRAPLCRVPQDPRCMPAAPSPAALALSSGSLPALAAVWVTPLPRSPEGRTASPQPAPDPSGLGPAAGYRRDVERPPRSRRRPRPRGTSLWSARAARGPRG